MYSGCMVDSLSWQMARSGLLTATVEIVAQDETLAPASAAGVVSPFALTRFGHFNGVITRNGANIGNVVSAEITYANTLDRIETIRADGKIEGADPSLAALTGKIDVRFADMTLLTQAINGEAFGLAFSYALPSGESLTLEAPRVFLPRPRGEIQGPQGVQVSFDWQASRQSNGEAMAIITLVNDVQSY
jgi:hypothetical protein